MLEWRRPQSFRSPSLPTSQYPWPEYVLEEKKLASLEGVLVQNYDCRGGWDDWGGWVDQGGQGGWGGWGDSLTKLQIWPKCGPKNSKFGHKIVRSKKMQLWPPEKR